MSAKQKGAFDVGEPVNPFGVKPDGGLFSTSGQPAFGTADTSALFAPEERIDNPFDDLDANAPDGEGLEEYSKRVFTVAELEFKKRAEVENKRMLDAVDTEFWVAICFQDRAQKEQFLSLLALTHLGDKYLDGWEVAKVLKLDLERSAKRYNISDKLDGKLSALARPLNGE